MPILWIGLLGACAHTKSTQREQGGESQQQQSVQVAAPRPVGTTPASVFTDNGTRTLQHALARHGYHVSPTGELDDQTRRALERFQRANQLASTGLPDYATCHALGVDPDEVFRTGSQSRATDAAKRESTKHEAAKQKHRAATDKKGDTM